MDTRPPTFADLGVATPLVDLLAKDGIVEPFPIQVATIPDAIDRRDVLGKGRTGSGKTLSFGLPLLTLLDTSGYLPRARAPRAVILVPTRELANQVDAVLAPLARTLDMTTLTIYGGVGYNKQIDTLKAGVDIVVACPGRFVDLMESGHVVLDDVEVTVLDEADHMAELGFLEPVTRILEKTPESCQRMLFSATLDRGIDRIVKRFLLDPVTHEVETAEEDEPAMSHWFFGVEQADKLPVITDLCAAPGKSLVFTRTKHGARKLAAALVKAGVPAVELHGDLSQHVRARNLAAFSAGKADTLVATDIAARGIHVDDIALVIHADPPEEHKAFLHRSGRTARAGAEGTVITLVTPNMRRHTKRLAEAAGIDPQNRKVAADDAFLAEIAPGERQFREMPSLDEPRRPRQGGGRRQGGGGRGQGGSRGQGGPRGRSSGGPRRHGDDRRSDSRGGDDRRGRSGDRPRNGGGSSRSDSRPARSGATGRSRTP